MFELKQYTSYCLMVYTAGFVPGLPVKEAKDHIPIYS